MRLFDAAFAPLVRDDPKEYALKQIEGTGISMSACREIAVSFVAHVVLHSKLCRSTPIKQYNYTHVVDS